MLARERPGAPRCREVAPLVELPGGAPERLARAVVARPAPEETPHALLRGAQALLEPSVERAAEEVARDVLGRHFEERIDAGLDRPLAQQIATERMDRADARLFQLLERDLEMARRGRPGRRGETRAFELRAKTELQLARRELGERDRDDAGELRAAGDERRHHAADERGRLAGPRGRLDDERRVEVGRDAGALRLIGERGRRGVRGRRAHGIPRRRTSACRLGRSFGFRLSRTFS